jgi:ABC-2 type transport system permease protein/sodium transport system permease protein
MVSLPRLVRLARKELREVLRDRRTIVTLVLMPLLLYPLLSIVFQRLLLDTLGEKPPALRIALEDQRQQAILEGLLQHGTQLLRAAADAAPAAGLDAMHSSPSPRAAADRSPPQDERSRMATDLQRPVEYFGPQPGDTAFRLQDAVARGEVELGVRVRALGSQAPGTYRVECLYRPESLGSLQALQYVHSRLEAVNRETLQQRGVPPSAIAAHLTAVAVAVEPQQALSLTMLIPLMLLLMTVTGAVYPAIDATAGERERGTLEAIVATPVPRAALLLAKYVAVVSVAALTGLVNLAALTITALGMDLWDVLFGRSGWTPLVIGQILLLLVLLAAFFSGVLLALCSFARSFKEAQAYLIPLMLVSLAPGLLCLAPGIHNTTATAVTPLVNLLLLGRDLLEGTARADLAVLAVVSTLVYAAAALYVAARVFGTDAVLFGSATGWSDVWHRPRRPQAAVSPASALLALGAMLPLFLLAGALTRRLASGIDMQLLASGVGAVVLFAGVPALIAWWQRVPLTEGLALRGAAWAAWPAAVLLGISLWPFEYEALLRWGPALDWYRQRAELLPRIGQASLAAKVLGLAIAAAVGEECFFRGFLLGALQRRIAPWKALLASAAAFGALHVFLAGGIVWERFFPSTAMGIVLGLVFLRTRSVLPGMLLHACHNALLLSLTDAAVQQKLSGVLAALQLDAPHQTHLSGTLLLWAAAAALCGAGLLWLARPPRAHDSGDVLQHDTP